MARIGFLYNHLATHQVLHTAPVAFALSKLDPDAQVHILASCERQRVMAERIGAVGWPDHRVTFHRLDLSHADQALAALHRRLDRGFKRRTLRANRTLLQCMDALVVPERTSAMLRQLPDVDHVQLILIPHGAGDRAVGYEPRNALFDLVLVPGEKCRQRMVTEAGVAARRTQVIGYPKFDVPVLSEEPRPFFEPRPTVLYNPHFDPSHSSWPKFGQSVLDFFANQHQFNLIFAPHVMLHRRTASHLADSLAPYRSMRHIHIDLGSDRCVDMTYTRQADVYVGDVSSQAYEFVVNPRPCVFLNAHSIQDWEQDANYQHWSLGTVIDDPNDLGWALKQPMTQDLLDRQRRMAASTFHSGPVAPSELGARLIREHLARHVMSRRYDASLTSDPVQEPTARRPMSQVHRLRFNHATKTQRLLDR